MCHRMLAPMSEMWRPVLNVALRQGVRNRFACDRASERTREHVIPFLLEVFRCDNPVQSCKPCRILLQRKWVFLKFMVPKYFLFLFNNLKGII